jgi:prevent-host-death family protein
MRTVGVHEAKTHLSRLLEEVRAGAEVVIARNGIPCARLVAIDRPTTRELGFLPGRVPPEFFDPLPDEDLAGWDGHPPSGA